MATATKKTTTAATPAATRKALESATNTAQHAAERAAHVHGRVSALRDEVEDLKRAVTELQEIVLHLRNSNANG